MDTLYPRILTKTLEVAEQKSKGFCMSRQLRKAIRRDVITATPSQATGTVNVPHYWAVYYHEGRRVITPVSATMLVWFRNPKNDPRLINGESPVYRSDIRKMTGAQFKFWSEQNRIARLNKLPVPMIVQKRSPGSGSPSFAGNPFFSDRPGGGLAGIDNALKDISTRESYSYVEQWLRKTGLKKKKIVRNF